MCIKSNRNKHKKKPVTSMPTYTKKLVKVAVTLGLINGTIPYILSAFGRDSVSALGIAWITEIVAVILGYLCKAYFETKQEKKQELENFKAGFEKFEEDNLV